MNRPNGEKNERVTCLASSSNPHFGANVHQIPYLNPDQSTSTLNLSETETPHILSVTALRLPLSLRQALCLALADCQWDISILETLTLLDKN